MNKEGMRGAIRRREGKEKKTKEKKKTGISTTTTKKKHELTTETRTKKDIKQEKMRERTINRKNGEVEERKGKEKGREHTHSGFIHSRIPLFIELIWKSVAIWKETLPLFFCFAFCVIYTH